VKKGRLSPAAVWAIVLALNLPVSVIGAGPDASPSALVFWPAAGFSLVAVMFFGRVALPPVFASVLGSVLLHAHFRNADVWRFLPQAVSLAAIQTAMAWSATWAIQRFAGKFRVFRSGGRFWRFIAILLLTTSLGAGLIAASVLLPGSMAPADVWSATIAAWCRAACSVFLIAPLAMIWMTPDRNPLPTRRLVEMFLLVGTFALLVCFTLGLGFSDPATTGFPRAALTVPMLLWIGFRCRGEGVTAALLAGAMVTFPAVSMGMSLFPESPANLSILYLEFYIVVLAIIGLGFVAVLEERDDNLAQLHALNEDLERKVSARTQQLEQINQELTDAVSMVAHDVRGPVSGISTLARHMRWARLDLSTSESDELLGEIERTSSEAVEMMGRLLDIQRMNHRAVGLTPANVGKLVADMCRHYELAAKEKGVALRVLRSKRERTHLVDTDGIKFIVSNLISNALKFLPVNGTAEVYVREGLSGCVLVVSDNGPGIPERDLARLFKRFEKASNRPTAGESSSGLGLFIVRKLVLAMNGTLSVESVAGEGATFVAEWPAEEIRPGGSDSRSPILETAV